MIHYDPLVSSYSSMEQMEYKWVPVPTNFLDESRRKMTQIQESEKEISPPATLDCRHRFLESQGPHQIKRRCWSLSSAPSADWARRENPKGSVLVGKEITFVWWLVLPWICRHQNANTFTICRCSILGGFTNVKMRKMPNQTIVSLVDYISYRFL